MAVIASTDQSGRGNPMNEYCVKYLRDSQVVPLAIGTPRNDSFVILTPPYPLGVNPRDEPSPKRRGNKALSPLRGEVERGKFSPFTGGEGLP